MSGLKYDAGKAPLTLLPKEALDEVAKVMAAGAIKYGKYNWMQGLEVDRLLDASVRHIYQFMYEGDEDEETKTLHAANAICNLMFAIWMVKNRPDLDNRCVKKLNK